MSLDRDREKVQMFFDELVMFYGTAMDQCIRILNQIDLTAYREFGDAMRVICRAMDGRHKIWKNARRGNEGESKDQARCGEYRRSFNRPLNKSRVRHAWRPIQFDPKRRMMPPNKRWPEVKE